MVELSFAPQFFRGVTRGFWYKVKAERKSLCIWEVESDCMQHAFNVLRILGGFAVLEHRKHSIFFSVNQ